MAREPLGLPSIAIVGMDCALPGAADLQAFADLLFSGRSGVTQLLTDPLDRELYYSRKRGMPGKTYTTLGGTVPPRDVPVADWGLTAEEAARFDPVHLRFCDVAVRAWKGIGLKPHDPAWKRTGIFVGHSGATRNGGLLSLATQIEEGLDFLNDLEEFQAFPRTVRERVLQSVAENIRRSRPRREFGHSPIYRASTVATLPARILGLEGPRIVCDAACASALFAMQQALLSIQMGRIDAAIVGGATVNGVDNLILFSQSQACSDTGSSPFDQAANGLISSEGYAAVVLMLAETARRRHLPILGIIDGLGTASDGRGKSLWAPRVEGQQLAMRRAYPAHLPLDIDYLEAHATSTQLGDATELQAVSSIRQEHRASGRAEPVLMGSLKSNIGHTLETAGVAGLIKILLSMQQGCIPASLNFQQPNANFDWSAGTIEVVRDKRLWPVRPGGKRAAVSAFGIGGLNAHLAIREAVPEQRQIAGHQKPNGQTDNACMLSARREPIAIVGRGVVLPGAHHLEQFRALLASGASVIGAPSAQRWRPGIGVGTGKLPHAHGGFIRDYQFDAQKYRIPPRQMQQANPLQLMLLDAVTQAIQELDGGSWEMDRRRTGVVIGTVFDGDFGSQLQLGLRLPEIERELREALLRQGITASCIDDCLQAYRQQVLHCRPALLDETGGFTASTLASRIAKTFDLMGGACAIDVENASGLAAIRLAMDQLRTGHWDVAVCGAAARSMDLNGFEQLHVTGKLLPSGRPEEIPDDGSQILPGEGAVVFLLERLSHARAAGRRIFGVLGEVDVLPYREFISTRPKGAGRIAAPDVRLARQMGSVTGVQGLIHVLKRTVDWEDRDRNVQIDARAADRRDAVTCCTEDGMVYHLTSGAAEIPEKPEKSVWQQARGSAEDLFAERGEQAGFMSLRPMQESSLNQTFSSRNSSGNPRIPRRASPAGHAAGAAHRLLRFQGKSFDELARQLDEAITRPEDLFQQPLPVFAADSPWRAALVADSPEQLAARVRSLRKIQGRGHIQGVFETERALVWCSARQGTRVAWVFPGQGGYYADGPDAIRTSPIVSAGLARIDEELVRCGLDPLRPSLLEPSTNWAAGLWGSQIWGLGLSLALIAELKTLGRTPDVVLGHSFGEYSALVAAGCLTLPQVIRMVKSRADAVAMTVRDPGQLISVRGAPSDVEAVIRQGNLPAILTHWNAPQQTVIATELSQLASVRQQLAAANFASVPVAVPVAFHTPRLAQAEELLKNLYAQERFLPPVCSLLSVTSVRYLCEPADLQQALTSQLTRPVQYVPAIERLIADDVGLVIEAGPNQVLSKLNRDIVRERALCLSLDLPGRDHAERRLLVQAALEIIGSRSHFPTISTETASSAVPFGDFHPSAGDSTIHQSVPATLDPVALEDVEIVDLHGASEKPRPVLSTSDENSFPDVPASRHSLPVAPLSVSHLSEQEIRSFLKTVVIDLTGYSPEVIDFDADLEADLGVDSIKKAQVIGELAETFELSIATAGTTLSVLHSLNDIVKIALAHEAPASQRDTDEDTVASPLQDAALSQWDLRSMERFLIDLVVDQTGYSPDIVDLDADMEGDLGIDSIKQAQLLGEVQQQFELPTMTGPTGTLTNFSTLRSILDFLTQALPGQGAAAFRFTATDSTDTPGQSLSDFDSVIPAWADKQAKFQRNGFHSDQHSESATSGDTSRVSGVTPTDEVLPEWQQLFAATPAQTVADAWAAGWTRGQKFQQEIRQAVTLLIDRGEQQPTGSGALAEHVMMELRGLAAGAGVSLPIVERTFRLFHAPAAVRSESALLPEAEVAVESTTQTAQTQRYVLRMVSAPQRPDLPERPQFTGSALILGNNAIADALHQQLTCEGVVSHCVPNVETLSELEEWLDQLWENELTPHLFVTTSHDAEAFQEIDADEWNMRRFVAVEVPYRLCQLWMQRMIETDRMEGASMVAVVNLGGDFGFSGTSCRSPEGGLSGLVKAMLIEAWMRGFRTTPMKVIDLSPETTPRQAVSGIWRELARPSYDMEVAWHQDERFAVQALERPLETGAMASSGGPSKVRTGGTWVVTGGARGITAVVARELAKRHRLTLHLIGTAPEPALSSERHEAARTDRLQLRRSVMAEAVRRGKNGMEAWRNVEKSLEIDETLQRLRTEGIEATYHSCDVSNRECLEETLERIRDIDGPIAGVIHGAGIGQDARFDRKRPDKVDQCLRAKIDGCINLIEATRTDSLDSFVVFGSISGRFGANGHTDYSLANDTLAKLIGRYRMERPDVTSVAFHWHAWGDIGMATKPETRLALEMIQLEFMPAREGIDHFLNELEFGGDEPEVLITDRASVRKFFPVERQRLLGKTSASAIAEYPLLAPRGELRPGASGPFSVELDPEKERFLNQHQIQGTPTLPFVVALEMMAEAARCAAGQNSVLEARNVQAFQALKWPTSTPRMVQIRTETTSDGVICTVSADVHRRDGRRVTLGKTFFEGTLFTTGNLSDSIVQKSVSAPWHKGINSPELKELPWSTIRYPERGDASVFHGPDLQCLQAIAISEEQAFGKISASSSVQLGGGHRPSRGWSVHCAAMDACLYACALLAGKRYGKSSLPVRFNRIRFGRLPDPGEPCLVCARLIEEIPGGVAMAFQLMGQNNDLILDVEGYQLGWLA